MVSIVSNYRAKVVAMMINNKTIKGQKKGRRAEEQ